MIIVTMEIVFYYKKYEEGGTWHESREDSEAAGQGTCSGSRSEELFCCGKTYCLHQRAGLLK